VLSRDRRLVPNDFTVELSTPDHERLTPFGGTLIEELATLVNDHVHDQRYTLAGPVKITFVEVPDLGTGRFRVRSKTNATVTAAEAKAAVAAAHRSHVELEVNGQRHPVPL